MTDNCNIDWTMSNSHNRKINMEIKTSNKNVSIVKISEDDDD